MCNTRYANRFGRVLIPCECSKDAANVSFGRVCILTNLCNPINQAVQVCWRKITFSVWIKEDGDGWEPAFCNPNSLISDSDEDSEGISDTFEIEQEEEEDECEEGEINENDDAQENSKVPESDFHGNCVDGDKPEDEGYVENSRLFSKPINVEVQIGENDEYIDTPIGDTSDAHKLVEHVLKEGDCHVLSNQNIPNNRIAEIEDEGVGELRLDTNLVHVGNDEGACDRVEVDPVGIALNAQKNKGIQAQFFQNGSSGCQGMQGYVEPLNQVDVSNDEDRSVQDTLDLDGGESSQSIDLNSEPLDIYDWYDIADEEARRRGRAKKIKKQR